MTFGGGSFGYAAAGCASDPLSTMPTITSIIVGDGELDVNLTAGVADVVFLRYRTAPGGGAWSAESGPLSITGSGTINIPSLTNGQAYEVGIYVSDNDFESDWDFMGSTPAAASATTSSGLIMGPIDNARNTVAGSVAFQTWTSTANQAAALGRVHAILKNSPTVSDLPLATIGWSEDFRRDSQGGGGQNFFDQSDSGLMLLFRAERDPGDDELDAMNKFNNVVSQIILDMEELAGRAGYLDMKGSRLVEGPYSPVQDESQAGGYDYVEIIFELRWVGT